MGKKKRYVKLHKNSIKYNFHNKIRKYNFVNFFLKSLTFSRISIKQLELVRRYIARKTNKFSYSRLKLKPFFFYTKKSQKSRMGKGIGSINSLELNIKPGNVLFEMNSVNYKESFNILLNASKKLPGKYKVFFSKIN